MRIRSLDLTFIALLLPLDAVALYAAALSAYALRFSPTVSDVLPILQNVPFQAYIETASAYIVAWLCIFAMAGLYPTFQRRAWNELGRIILACGAGTMLVIASIFFQRELAVSRFIVLAVLGFSILYVWIGRLFLRVMRHALLNARIGHRRFVIVGGATAERIADAYQAQPIHGITIVRQFKLWDDKTRAALKKLIESDDVDGIILAEPDIEKSKALDLIAFAEEEHVAFRYLADLFAATFTNIQVTTDTGVPMIEVKRTPLDGWGRIAKRTFDIFFATLLLILFSPIILLAELALLIEDGLPVVFRNTRVGERGREFDLFKLRSMYRKYSIGPQFKGSEAENLKLEKDLIAKNSIKEGPVYKIDEDPRVTPVGHFIRRWSIDELPQFVNVLKGDMSLVGPRPHQPREVASYAHHHRRVLAIRPGITGLAQISGRSDLDFEDEVRLDTWYIENWSPALDLYILLKTPFTVLARKGAY